MAPLDWNFACHGRGIAHRSRPGPLITQLNLQSFIVTLGGMLLVRGVSQTIVKGGTLGFGDSPFRNSPTRVGFKLRRALLPYPLLIFIAVVLVAAYVLHFTVFGRYVYAIGGNRDAAEYSGIAVRKVETITYVISAGLAGVAGICYAAYIGQMSQQVGIAFELYAIAAAVLGGFTSRRRGNDRRHHHRYRHHAGDQQWHHHVPTWLSR